MQCLFFDGPSFSVKTVDFEAEQIVLKNQEKEGTPYAWDLRYILKNRKMKATNTNKSLVDACEIIVSNDITEQFRWNIAWQSIV